MEQLDRWLARLDRGWLVVVSAVLFLFFLLVVLPNQAQRAAVYAEGVGSPDTDLLTPPPELYRIAEAYGSEGRRQYIRARWTFDVVFPLAYGLFFFSTINFSFRRFWAGRPGASRAALLAPAASLADLTENTLMTMLMGFYPWRSDLLALVAVAVSTIKWLLVYGAMTLALFGLLVVGFKAIRGMILSAE